MAKVKKSKPTMVAEFDPLEEMAPIDPMMVAEPAPPEEDEFSDPTPAEVPMEEPAPEEMVNPQTGVPESLTKAAKPASQQFIEMMQSPEYQAKVAEYNDLVKKSLGDQRAGIADNENAIKEIEGLDTQVDLSPLAAYVDSQTGSKFSQSYARPDSKEDRIKKVLGLKNQLQLQRQGLTKQELDLLKSSLMGLGGKSGGREAGTQARSDRAYNLKVDDAIDKRYAQATKDAESKGAEYNNLIENLDSGDLSTITASLSKFARLVGDEKGALSEGDTGRVMAKDLEQRAQEIQRYFTGGGKLNNHMVQSMKKMADQGRKFLKYSYNKKIGKTRDSLKALPAYKDAPGVDSLYEVNSKLLEDVFAPRKMSMMAQSKPMKKASGGLQIGTVQDGHVYMGGDPANPSSWKAQ